MADSVDQGRQHRPSDSQPSADTSVLAYMASDSDSRIIDEPRSQSPQNDSSLAQASSTSTIQFTERPNVPHRASTVSSPYDHDQRKPRTDEPPHARSEDLNHTTVRNMDDLHISDQPFRAQQFLSANSRPTTPANGSTTLAQPPSDPSASYANRPSSAHSDSSAYSDASAGGGSAPAGTSTTHTSASIAST